MNPIEQFEELLTILKTRFLANQVRHETLDWEKVQERLLAFPQKLATLQKMEDTGGEPDVLELDAATGEYIFYDCAKESPIGRRSICYDQEAQIARKKYPPANNAIDMAQAIGVELLSKEHYQKLQQFGPFDTKTSSWIKTPPEIRTLGGALFADYRYGQVFIYHNGADSYFSARGFRALLRV